MVHLNILKEVELWIKNSTVVNNLELKYCFKNSKIFLKFHTGLFVEVYAPLGTTIDEHLCKFHKIHSPMVYNLKRVGVMLHDILFVSEKSDRIPNDL